MEQPLWKFTLNLALIGFVARRAAVGLALNGAGAHSAWSGVYVALAAACAFAAIAIWKSSRWVMAGLIVLVLAFGVTTSAELAAGSGPAVWLIAQLLVAVIGAAILLVLAHHDRTV
jgi:hypothetical protein